jgi:hypothetical protein
MTATVPEASRQLRVARGIAQPPPPTPLVEPTAEHVAPMTVWLCTDDAWNVNGKIFHVAGGAVSLAHEEYPIRELRKDGRWEVDELIALVPNQLLAGIPNPAPPPPDMDLPGRPAQAASG